MEDDKARRSRRALAGFLLVAGTIHFALPKPYMRLIPAWLPGTPRFWVYFSGVWEMVAGALLVSPKTKRVGGYAAAATIVAIYPGNIKMAIDAGTPTAPPGIVAWARLPLQVPLLAWALRQTRG